MNLSEKGLLPCPFCGNADKPSVFRFEGEPYVPGFEVRCDASGWDGQDGKGCGSASGWSETTAEAIAAWNRRAYLQAAGSEEWQPIETAPKDGTRVEEAIIEAFGARCPDFAEGCPCCDAWAEYDALASSEAARIKAEGEVERLRKAMEKIEAHPIRTPVAGRPCAGLPGYPACQDIARAALRREPSTALEHGKTEGGGE